jgi:hypothetical protein
MDDENAHQYQSYQDCRIKSMADFYLNNWRSLESNNEIFALGSKEIMHLTCFKWRRWSFDSNPDINVHFSNKFSGAVPVYYDLKRIQLGTWFESFRELDLTKVKCGLVILICQPSGYRFIWKVSGFRQKMRYCWFNDNPYSLFNDRPMSLLQVETKEQLWASITVTCGGKRMVWNAEAMTLF